MMLCDRQADSGSVLHLRENLNFPALKFPPPKSIGSNLNLALLLELEREAFAFDSANSDHCDAATAAPVGAQGVNDGRH